MGMKKQQEQVEYVSITIYEADTEKYSAFVVRWSSSNYICKLIKIQ